MCYSTKIQTFCELNTAWVSLTILLQHNAFSDVMPSGWISDYNILLVSSPFSSGVPVSSSILCPFGHAFIYLCAFIFLFFILPHTAERNAATMGAQTLGSYICWCLQHFLEVLLFPVANPLMWNAMWTICSSAGWNVKVAKPNAWRIEEHTMLSFSAHKLHERRLFINSLLQTCPIEWELSLIVFFTKSMTLEKTDKAK